MEDRTQQLNWLFQQVFQCCDAVHNALGRNLPGSTYKACVVHELETGGLKVQQDVKVPIVYGEIRVEDGITIPLIVNGLAAVAIHSVENLSQFYDHEMHAILRISGLPLGITVNFTAPSVRGAMHRIMNPQPRV